MTVEQLQAQLTQAHLLLGQLFMERTALVTQIRELVDKYNDLLTQHQDTATKTAENNPPILRKRKRKGN